MLVVREFSSLPNIRSKDTSYDRYYGNNIMVDNNIYNMYSVHRTGIEEFYKLHIKIQSTTVEQLHKKKYLGKFFT